jgi:dolichyl-phosphate beta-glucosyltransferase
MGPRLDLPPLSLVIPLYNEESRVGETFDEVLDFIRSQGSTAELIFVDDGSEDRTPELVRGMLRSVEGVDARLLCLPHRGKGAAVCAGLGTARSEYAGFCDVDLSTPFGDLRQIVKFAADHSGTLAIGSREAPGAHILQRSRARQLLGRQYNHLLRTTVIHDITDTQCGAKFASSAVWRRILPHCREVGFAWDAEVIAIAQSLGIKVAEVPIVWRHDNRSKVRPFRDGIKMLLAIRRIKRRVRAVARLEAAEEPPRLSEWEVD